MKKVISILFVSIIGVLFTFLGISDVMALEIWDGTTSTTFSGGTGTENDPFQISNGKELSFLQEVVNNNLNYKIENGNVITLVDGDNQYKSAYYELTDSIVLNDTSNLVNWTTEAPTNEWNPIGTDTNKFEGYFNGNGHRIVGLYFDDPTANYVGLFGISHSFGDMGVIQNFGLVDGYIHANNNVGSVIGQNEHILYNIYSNVTVVGETYPTGGIIGYVGNNTGSKSAFLIYYGADVTASPLSGRNAGEIAGGVIHGFIEYSLYAKGRDCCYVDWDYGGTDNIYEFVSPTEYEISKYAKSNNNLSDIKDFFSLSKDPDTITNLFYQDDAPKIKLNDWLYSSNELDKGNIILKENNNITYNLNGGEFEGNVLNNYTTSILQTLPIPTKINYEFDGWYENSNFTGSKITEITNTDFGNKVYYAKWKQIISEINPQTSDSIMSSVLLGSISIIGLLGASIYLKKKRFN